MKNNSWEKLSSYIKPPDGSTVEKKWASLSDFMDICDIPDVEAVVVVYAG